MPGWVTHVWWLRTSQGSQELQWPLGNWDSGWDWTQVRRKGPPPTGGPGSLNGVWDAGCASAERRPRCKWAEVQPASQAGRRQRRDASTHARRGRRRLQGTEGGRVLGSSGRRHECHRLGAGGLNNRPLIPSEFLRLEVQDQSVGRAGFS